MFYGMIPVGPISPRNTLSLVRPAATTRNGLLGGGEGWGGGSCSKAYSACGALVSVDSLLKSVLQHLLQVKLTSPKVEPTDGFLSHRGKKAWKSAWIGHPNQLLHKNGCLTSSLPITVCKCSQCKPLEASSGNSLHTIISCVRHPFLWQ